MNPSRLLVLLVSLPLLLGGCGGSDEVTDETKPKLQSVNYGELRLRGSLTEGIIYRKGSDTPYTGKAFEFYDNGQKEFEQYYKEGKEDGLSVWWYRNGQKQIEQNFKDGILDGLQVQWHRNGQKAVEGNFKDGKMQGLWIAWHNNGQKRNEDNYKNGKVVKGSEKYWNSKGEPVDSFEEAEQ